MKLVKSEKFLSDDMSIREKEDILNILHKDIRSVLRKNKNKIAKDIDE